MPKISHKEHMRLNKIEREVYDALSAIEKKHKVTINEMNYVLSKEILHWSACGVDLDCEEQAEEDLKKEKKDG